MLLDALGIESVVFRILFLIWLAGYWAGFGLFLFKYGDYHLHKGYYNSSRDLKELYWHDHKPQMIVRNWLFYCCLSWYGVWSFIVKED